VMVSCIEQHGISFLISLLHYPTSNLFGVVHFDEAALETIYTIFDRMTPERALAYADV
jgi:hypothetical protein